MEGIISRSTAVLIGHHATDGERYEYLRSYTPSVSEDTFAEAWNVIRARASLYRSLAEAGMDTGKAAVRLDKAVRLLFAYQAMHDMTYRALA